MLWGVVGNVGYGKTLLMTYYAQMWLKAKKRVFANYHIFNGGNLFQLMKTQYFINLSTLENSLALLDEAYSWLESRFSGSEINRILSHRIFQSRKRGVDIIHSSQLASSIDLRLRRLTSTLIWAIRPDDNGFNYVYFTPDGTYHRSIKMELARKLFTTYDTHELVEEQGEEEPEEAEKKPRVERPDSDFNEYIKQLEELQKSFASVSSHLVKQINTLKTQVENANVRVQKLEVLVQQMNKRRTP